MKTIILVKIEQDYAGFPSILSVSTITCSCFCESVLGSSLVVISGSDWTPVTALETPTADASAGEVSVSFSTVEDSTFCFESLVVWIIGVDSMSIGFMMVSLIFGRESETISIGGESVGIAVSG